MTAKDAISKNVVRSYIDRVVVFLELEYKIPVVFERDGETALFHDKRELTDGDFIIVNNRVSLEKQLYMLLHEAGHVLLREDVHHHTEHFPASVSKTKRLSRAHKIDILREEVLAWEAGKDIARDFGIPIDNKLWHSMTCSALFKYVNWCIDAQ